MKIIGKTNEHNVQIYDMSINLEKARIYRKKVVGCISFCRFEYLKNRDYYNLKHKIEDDKTIYGFETYSLGYSSIPYKSINLGPIGIKQEEFIKDYILNGLSDFKFIHIPGEEHYNFEQAYVFLNQIQENKQVCYSDNVAIIDSYAMVLFFLEKGLIKEAIHYLNVSKWNKILDCFDFSFNSQINLNEENVEELEKTIKLHRPIFNYVQNEK